MLTKILLWVMNFLIIAISLYLLIIYTVSKSFRSYPCYLNIILSFVIAIDNILRLLRLGDSGTIICYFQAFTLALFDKLIFASITVNTFLTYIGVKKYALFKAKMKILFLASNIIGLIIGFIFAIIFIIIDEPQKYENVCYVNSSSYKEISDTITTFCLFLINSYCNLKLLLYLVSVIKELYVIGRNIKDFSKHFFRIFISLILTTMSFLIVILIINDSLFFDDDLIDLCYITICLILDLFFTFNKTVIKETYKLFCCKKDMEEKDKVKENQPIELENKNEKEDDDNNYDIDNNNVIDDCD